MTELKPIPLTLVDALYEWLGEENLRWFRHLKNLKGSYAPVLKLNSKRKGLPAHPVHFREGMQIRNFLRDKPECQQWTGHDFDDQWQRVVELAITIYIDPKYQNNG